MSACLRQFDEERIAHAVERYYENRGYDVVDRRLSSGTEIGLVAVSPCGYWTFADVRISPLGDGLPARVADERIDDIEAAAIEYLSERQLSDISVAFDVVNVAILPGDKVFIRRHAGV